MIDGKKRTARVEMEFEYYSTAEDADIKRIVASRMLHSSERCRSASGAEIFRVTVNNLAEVEPDSDSESGQEDQH